MWKKSKQKISAGDDSTNIVAGRDFNLFLAGNIPVELVDKSIVGEVDQLRRSRFFPEFNSEKSALRLGARLAEGDLSAGSNQERGSALAWCARILSLTANTAKAEEFLELSKTLGDFPEIDIAEAFIVSKNRNKREALKLLASINSEVSRSAGLAIVAHHDGTEAALNWLNDAGYTLESLDSYGKSLVLNRQLELCRWDEAANTVDLLSQIDFDKTPVLYHLAAVTRLLAAVPLDLRTVIVRQPPFEAVNFRLASDAISMNTRRTAHGLFLDAVKAAQQLNCPDAAQRNDEYALWLELCDPQQSAYGRSRLEKILREPSTALGFVHYAIQFGIKLDLDAVERSIEECIAINGGLTGDAAVARYALALTQRTPEEAANYLDSHHNQLASYIDANLMRYRQIELLSQAKLIDRANAVLDDLVAQGIPQEEEGNLRRIISEAKGHDPVESRKAQYKESGALADLINLVNELEHQEHWSSLCEYGKRLFDQTGSLLDAERLVQSFDKTNQPDELIRFLENNSDLLPQSNLLRMTYAWSLYYEGAFLESSAALAELSDDEDPTNYRALRLNLGIATGDWDSLSGYVVSEYKNRDDRSADELIAVAQLALHLSLPQAKNLVFEAAAKAGDDPIILSTAYFIATSAGWEDDPLVVPWLEKAAELSEDNGPLQKMSLKDILDQKPDWDRRESETWRLLASGQMPIFLASRSLNRTLIDLTVFPALTNLNELDPRKRNSIPAYSGKRVAIEVDVSEKAIALDATALLTLSFLKILDIALDACKAVYIPHSTLTWLFEERQKATFHQPSRIANAREVRDFIATDVLEKFAPSSVGSSDLAAQVGDELAALIAEAEMVREADDKQHIVVRSAPVHRISSLMEEEADLSAYAPFLSSCLAVVDKLREKGQLTAGEEKRARTYLHFHEKPWSNQPDIADGATLYLDDLAVSFLQHLGLLGKLKSAGLKAIVSPREVAEVDALISYEKISEEVKDVIEDIRASLNSRIESKHVMVSGRHKIVESKTTPISQHPSVGIFALSTKCDFLVIDDRFLNQHANIDIDNGAAQVPVLSTLDLIDALVAANVLTEDNSIEHRTRLRRAGYFFVPLSEGELERSLNESNIADGQVIETAELKAIRESVTRVRMSDWLQIPEEAPWLDKTLKVFIQVLKNIWVDGANSEHIVARSNWILKQVDIRGWVHNLVPENADRIIQIGRAAHLFSLLTLPSGVKRELVDEYWNWLDERVLAPMQEQSIESFEWLVDQHRSYIAKIAETPLPEEESS
ncbi:hypothetical protein GCM10008090_23130 [Arenicella chitinivorans]|uniref:HNH endonuclease n=1 Tax=Arenicella chitinivorans TaxID=1329800 RepID=A0A918VPP1_9GAMM|nr:hypothetical protein [Arenicella chitinivorans]GHA12587.1 hypothetical protein GCM10008090_23130 [Arenicella chitinivorans]